MALPVAVPLALPIPRAPPTDAEFAAEPQAYGWGIQGMAEVQQGLEMDTLAAEAAGAHVVWVQFCNYPHWPVRALELPYTLSHADSVHTQ